MITLPRSRSLAMLAAVATCLAACSSAPDAEAPSPPATAAVPATLDSVQPAVEQRVSVFEGLATGVIALVRVGEQTGVVTSGLAVVDRLVSTHEGQRFPIASITKPMVATAVLQLVEEDLVALDDPAEKWLPELRGVEPVITVEDLLSHRSGLRDSRDADIRQHGFASHDLLLASAAHPLDFPPGSRGRYANVGYGALGLLLERVRMQPLGEVLEQQIFGPAAMVDSELQGRPQVHGYTDGEDVTNEIYLQLLPAAGSVVSTVGDVDRFFQSLWSGKLLDPTTVAEMRTVRGNVEQGAWSDYGLGLATLTLGCGTAYGHGGRINGYTIEAWTLEDGDRSTVVLVNDFLSNEVVAGIVTTALCG